MARIPTAMRPWEAVHVEVHASQTEPKLCGLHVLSRHGLPRCFWPRSRRRSPCARKPHIRRSLGSCDSPMRCACRYYRSATCTQLSLFDPAGSLLLQPAREQTPPGFEDAPVEPGLLCDVPARILHGSGSGGSHAFDVEVLDPAHVEPAGRSGLVFSSQSLRRSPSLAFNRPIRVLTFLRRFDPRRARASLRCSRRSRSASFARKPLGLVISPVDSATATVTPRSTRSEEH